MLSSEANSTTSPPRTIPPKIIIFSEACHIPAISHSYHPPLVVGRKRTVEKVLVVEDEPSIAHLIAYNLEQAGYCVEIAEDGEQACARVESFGPDLMTLDLLLPLKAAGRPRIFRRHSDACVRQVPIIVVSALASQRSKQNCNTAASTTV